MDRIRAIDSLSAGDIRVGGGKAVHLGALARAGFRVPSAHVLLVPAYDDFVDRTGLRGRILLELNRKSRERMRWEEMWDASLRIRNMFATTAWPADSRAGLERVLREAYGDAPVAVRSSAPAEDSGTASFAGVHESFVNVRGIDEILDRVKLVWASLFSDRALLYARELGIDVLRSGMAVVVQKLVSGCCSGVVFTRSPVRRELAAVEAVYGLNQGLVDGTIEPDRWSLSRETGRVKHHEPAAREERLAAQGGGVGLEPLPAPLRSRAPLDEPMLAHVWEMAMKVEQIFGAPQDVEWTFDSDELFVLQSRPITTSSPEELDPKRAWYVSLRRSYENLEKLRALVEEERLPAMARDAKMLTEVDLSSLSDEKLDDEVERRRRLYRKWHDVYWEEMIPLAHGVRLFGELYNAAVKPEDPYEFMQLLHGLALKGVQRNDRLLAFAARLEAAADRDSGPPEPDPETRRELEGLLVEFGGAFEATSDDWDEWARLLSRMAQRARQAPSARRERGEALEARYLERFDGKERERARGVLELARASYRLRDDDNLYLGRLEKLVGSAEDEQRRRGRAPAGRSGETQGSEELALSGRRLHSRGSVRERRPETSLGARQLIGQPAGPGLARGRARVVRSREDLFAFEEGELLICDAVDPNMTFVVPLAGAVVERRGGMLIHGAIIAREYGLPCVTGIPEATEQIETGDEISVDGYLGLVTVHGPSRHPS